MGERKVVIFPRPGAMAWTLNACYECLPTAGRLLYGRVMLALCIYELQGEGGSVIGQNGSVLPLTRKAALVRPAGDFPGALCVGESFS